MNAKRFLILLLFISVSISKAQEGHLIRRELFTIPTSKFSNAAGFSFKIAVNSKEMIAFNACSAPKVFFFDSTGVQIDSITLPFSACVRNMEFDENDNL